MLDRLYWQGSWDEVAERTDELLARWSSESHNIVTIDAHILRARLDLARGAIPGALEESARGLELAEGQGDPQETFPALATRARVLLESGDEAQAGATVDELFKRWKKSPTSAPGPWVAEVAAVLVGLGKGAELMKAAERVALRTRWLDGAEALVKLASDGRREEAEAQLGLALEFFRAAGAERYVREAEAVLSVS